jgi:thymidine kinase
MENNTHKAGRLEVICGSMFSGKTEELLRRLKRAEFAQKKIVTFKNQIDTRSSITTITTHCGKSRNAHPINNDPTHIWDILEQTEDNADVIAFDEIQFFSPEIIHVIEHLVHEGKRVIATGLDLDFRGESFDVVSKLLTLADDVTKLKAICVECGDDAHYSQRVIDGKPANYNDPIILVGAEEAYQARCRKCFTIPGRPEFKHHKPNYANA